MKLLIDECVDWRLKNSFFDCDVWTVQEMGWLGKSNGKLMDLASKNGFQVLITVDKNLRYQQHLKQFDLAIIVLNVQRNTLKHLKPLIPPVLKKIPDCKQGEVYIIG